MSSKKFVKIINKDKRNFFKISSLIFLSIFQIKDTKLNFLKNLKLNSHKYLKKNKKIWILKENDFR